MTNKQRTNEERTYELTDRTESRTMSVISIDNDEYETEYHHCARNIELLEKLRVSASESVIETDI